MSQLKKLTDLKNTCTRSSEEWYSFLFIVLNSFITLSLLSRNLDNLKGWREPFILLSPLSFGFPSTTSAKTVFEAIYLTLPCCLWLLYIFIISKDRLSLHFFYFELSLTFKLTFIGTLITISVGLATLVFTDPTPNENYFLALLGSLGTIILFYFLFSLYFIFFKYYFKLKDQLKFRKRILMILELSLYASFVPLAIIASDIFIFDDQGNSKQEVDIQIINILAFIELILLLSLYTMSMLNNASKSNVDYKLNKLIYGRFKFMQSTPYLHKDKLIKKHKIKIPFKSNYWFFISLFIIEKITTTFLFSLLPISEIDENICEDSTIQSILFILITAFFGTALGFLRPFKTKRSGNLKYALHLEIFSRIFLIYFSILVITSDCVKVFEIDVIVYILMGLLVFCYLITLTVFWLRINLIALIYVKFLIWLSTYCGGQDVKEENSKEQVLYVIHGSKIGKYHFIKPIDWIYNTPNQNLYAIQKVNLKGNKIEEEVGSDYKDVFGKDRWFTNLYFKAFEKLDQWIITDEVEKREGKPSRRPEYFNLSKCSVFQSKYLRALGSTWLENVILFEISDTDFADYSWKAAVQSNVMPKLRQIHIQNCTFGINYNRKIVSDAIPSFLAFLENRRDSLISLCFKSCQFHQTDIRAIAKTVQKLENLILFEFIKNLNEYERNEENVTNSVHELIDNLTFKHGFKINILGTRFAQKKLFRVLINKFEENKGLQNVELLLASNLNKKDRDIVWEEMDELLYFVINKNIKTFIFDLKHEREMLDYVNDDDGLSRRYDEAEVEEIMKSYDDQYIWYYVKCILLILNPDLKLWYYSHSLYHQATFIENYERDCLRRDTYFMAKLKKMEMRGFGLLGALITGESIEKFKNFMNISEEEEVENGRMEEVKKILPRFYEQTASFWNVNDLAKVDEILHTDMQELSREIVNKY